MCIRQADPRRGKPPGFDHVPNILQPHRAEGNQLVEIDQRFLAFRQRAERQLRDQEWVNAELVIGNQCVQLCLASASTKHGDPDRSVRQNHCSSTRNLRTSSIFGEVPASARSLRPASRAINDFNAARINAALSVKPLYSSAVRSRSSSSDTVALIFPPCTDYSTDPHIRMVPLGRDRPRSFVPGITVPNPINV